LWWGSLKLHHAIVHLRQNLALRHLVRQLHVRLFERPAKTSHPVTILAYILAFRFVQDVPDVRPAVPAGFHHADEIFDQLLEENIIFPECVVCIDQQCVSLHGFSMMPLLTAIRSTIPPGAGISVTAPAHLRRSGWLPRAAPWRSPRASSPQAFPADQGATRSSKPPPEGCYSEWP